MNAHDRTGGSLKRTSSLLRLAVVPLLATTLLVCAQLPGKADDSASLSLNMTVAGSSLTHAMTLLNFDVTPFLALSGQSGPGSLTVTKELDLNSPQLWTAVVTGSSGAATIQVAHNAGGLTSQQVTITLSNAVITSVRQHRLDPVSGTAMQVVDDVRISYGSISVSKGSTGGATPLRHTPTR